MDMPHLSRIDSHARVSAVSRSDELHADGSRAFAALIVGEEAARRRRAAADDEPTPDGDSAAQSAQTAQEPAVESIIEPQLLTDADEVLPEDALDPQELRAMLAAPTGDV